MPEVPSAEKLALWAGSESGFFKRIGELRDGFLVLITGVYLLGYLCWASYAWQNNIGLLPALDAQYLAAGVVPALVVIVFYFLSYMLLRLYRWLSTELPPKLQKASRVIGNMGLAVLLICALGQMLPEQVASWLTIGAVAGLLIWVASAFFRRGDGWFIRGLGLYYLWSYLIIGTFWVMATYMVQWFPEMPQEFGGPSPRLVQLDLATEHLSKETMQALLPAGKLAAPKEVSRSRDVYLFFEGNDFILVKMTKEPSSNSGPVFKIRKEAIKSISPGNLESPGGS